MNENIPKWKREWKHDCKDCHSMGSVSIEWPNGPTYYDLYFCWKPDIGTSLIARYGDYPEDYHSGFEPGKKAYMELTRDPLAIAYSRFIFGEFKQERARMSNL